MIAYTGIETVSNLAEEARDPVRSIPRSIGLVAVAVFAIYFTLPLVALSALPVEQVGGEYVTKLGLPPEEGGFAERPGARPRGQPRAARLGALRDSSLRRHPRRDDPVHRHERRRHRRLPDHVLDGRHRQLPGVFRRLHPRFKTPWLALVVFAGIISILVLLPGQTTSSATCTRSARCSRSRSRTSRSSPAHALPRRGARVPRTAEPQVLRRRLAAVRDLRRRRHRRSPGSSSSPRSPADALGRASPGSRSASSIYWVYRRRIVHVPLRATVRAPVVLGPSLTLDYRTILVPVAAGAESEEALVARRAARRPSGARASSPCAALEVPLDLPLDAYAARRRRSAPRRCSTRRAALLESYGVRALTRLVARAQRGPGDRRGGGAPRRRDHHHGRPAQGRRERPRRSSGAPSTTC